MPLDPPWDRKPALQSNNNHVHRTGLGFNQPQSYNNSRKGYVTADNKSSDIWVIPPPTQEPRSRFFNPNAPPPFFKPSSAGEPTALPLSGGVGAANVVSNLQASSAGYPKLGASLSLLKRPAHDTTSGASGRNKNSPGDDDDPSSPTAEDTLLDAAKRKNLPAWIR